MVVSSRRRLAVLVPTGEIFVNGLASSYDEAFPDAADSAIAAYMTRDEFHKAITKINDALQDHWPCLPCTSFAYGCCVCTLGLSFYCATAQVREAEERVRLQLRRINDQENFKARQVEWTLVRVWYKRTSYVEITVTTDAPTPQVPATYSTSKNPPREEEEEEEEEDNTDRPPQNEVMDGRYTTV